MCVCVCVCVCVYIRIYIVNSNFTKNFVGKQVAILSRILEPTGTDFDLQTAILKQLSREVIQTLQAHFGLLLLAPTAFQFTIHQPEKFHKP